MIAIGILFLVSVMLQFAGACELLIMIGMMQQGKGPEERR